jgi:hypothetical protein
MTTRVLGLLCGATIATMAFAGEGVADCTCRALGQNFELGRSICLGERLATCAMVLNNTSWSISSTPCVVSSLTPVGSAERRSVSLSPRRQPGLSRAPLLQ